jgi:hypothetical protein
MYSDRQSRLACTIVELFHQTTEERAKEILSSQSMHRGLEGSAGGGIYFAGSEHATYGKAHHHGVILKAKVHLGRVLVLVGEAIRHMTFSELKRLGYDSVLVTGRFNTGDEYVVYNWDQVTDIRRVWLQVPAARDGERASGHRG